ncbi:hypothetical protein SUGI_1016210 [Cryptomeria japonica]|nr:hypothetical protein SUGI_1016210 [Cryptomeria japonica]
MLVVGVLWGTQEDEGIEETCKLVPGVVTLEKVWRSLETRKDLSAMEIVSSYLRILATTCCCSSSSPSQEDYQNIMNNLVAGEAMSHIDELISYIDKLLKEERKVDKKDEVDSSINSAGGLLKKVLKRSKRHLCKRDFKGKLNRETRKLMIDVTNQATQIKWLGVAL